MVDRKWKHFKLDKGDVVISASASTGIISIVGDDTVGAIPYTGLIRFKVGSRLLKEFLIYFILSDIYLEQINMQQTGSTIQHYGPSHLGRMKLLLPPKEEQQKIVAYLDSKCSQIDHLITQKEQLVSELESYKKSLIYEYVTGKKQVV
jgi:type I restriction enzyme S subunit